MQSDVPRTLVGVSRALASDMSCLWPADKFDPIRCTHVSHCRDMSTASAVYRKLDKSDLPPSWTIASNLPGMLVTCSLKRA